ncbi:MAG: BamA/TamA family outer membrane protein [Bryobacteraceae bacterium]
MTTLGIALQLTPRNFGITSCLLLCTIGLSAQNAPTTRAAEIEQARDAKIATLKPEEVSKTEGRLRAIKEQHLLERISSGYNGLRVKLGGIVTGGGFAVGPEYLREDLLGGKMMLRASAQASTKHYTNLEAETEFRKLWDDRVTLSLLATRRDYGGLNYYGPGPDSELSDRSNYRLEDTATSVFGTLRPVRAIKLGASTGGLWINTGPGTDKRFASAETLFSPAVAPGIDRQTNYQRTSVFGQVDYRDDPLGPKAGGNYVFQHTWYRDIGLGAYGFRRTDIDLQQYIPFLNKTHRIALRAKATFTESDAGQQTPFYLQPILGGSDDLRGYRFFRFSDRNMVVYNAEYQWEIFAGLEGAVFADAGKVMAKRGQLGFSSMESDAGFGLRFNANNRTFMRFDVGFSHEGFQMWFKFNDIFNARRFGTSAGQPIY